MPPSRALSALGLSLVVVVAGCGEPPGPTVASRQVAEPPPTVAAAGPLHATPSRRPELTFADGSTLPRDRNEVAVFLAVNPNRPDTAIGALCWTYWEILRTFLLEATSQIGDLYSALAEGNPQDAEPIGPIRLSHPGAARLLSSIGTNGIDAGRSRQLPVEVQPFATALLGSIERARSDGSAKRLGLGEHFPLDTFPGAGAFSEMAGAEPDCARSIPRLGPSG